MALSDRIEPPVSTDQQTAGRYHYQAGHVKSLSMDEHGIFANVRNHSVDVYPNDDGTLEGECSCGYSDDPGISCGHIWATVLAAQHRDPGLEARMFGTIGRLPLRAAEGNPQPAANTREPLWTDRIGASINPIRPQFAPPPPQKKKAQKPETPPQWKLQFAAITQAARVGPSYHEAEIPKPLAGQVLYVIDASTILSRADGQLIVEVHVRDRGVKGNWNKPKVRRPDQIAVGAFPDPADQQAVAMLKAGLDRYAYAYGHNFDGFSVQRPLWRTLLPPLCATGRTYLRLGKDEPFDRWRPLAWEPEPWLFWLRGHHDEVAKRYEITGELRRGEQRMGLDKPYLLLAGGLVFAEGRVSPFDDAGAFYWVNALRRTPVIRVPEAHAAEMLDQLLTLPSLPRREFPGALHVDEVAPKPRPHLRVRAAKSGEFYADKLRGELAFDYDGLKVPLGAAGQRAIFRRDTRQMVVRDPAAEDAAVNRLESLGLKLRREYYSDAEAYLIPKGKLPTIVTELTADGWSVEADGKLYRTPGTIDLHVTSGIDWFELHGKVEFGDQSVALPALLAALRRGESLVTLGDGTVGMLPEDWLKKYGLIAGAGTVEGDHLRFKPTQAGLLDALLAAQPQASCDELFARTRAELRAFEGVKPLDPPATFLGNLRPYQRDGLGWFAFLRRFGFGGCLADDMGLGKTVQVLALLDQLRADRQAAEEHSDQQPEIPDLKSEISNSKSQISNPQSEISNPKSKIPAHRPSLVVVPRSLVFNWLQEAKRFAPQLKVLDNSQTQRAKTPAELAGHDVVLATYGTLLRDIASLKDVEFDTLVLDEAQAVKNAATESAKSVRLLNARHRLALSGTPIQNHLGELWSLFEFLNPGMLGSASVFASATSAARMADDTTRGVLSQALRPFVLRRTKAQVARDLPDRVEQTIYCELEAEQRKLYDELRDHYRATLLGRIETEGLAKSKIQILEALLRLRQAALHPGLIDKKHRAHSSAKLDMLLPRLTQIIDEGHKVLVFSQFTGMLSIVRDQLDKQKVTYEYLDGKTKDRQARVERFQTDEKCKLFLISLKAGGLGLNLTAAEYVFLLDPWWNPAVEAQAIDRAHRIGQTRQVFACRLIAKDTVEEKVLALQETKRSLADAIITADNSLIRTLGREDLELLLS